MTTKDGYYWVKNHGHWIIAEFEYNNWYICGREDIYYTSDFDEIGPKVERTA